mmetsp:Transcript_21605/g.33568  ORF Transcript_21605/g.33568 Transcript_21605/m.33568 type:complete len:86 (-) Transcript_21605:355-612(-)
MGERKLATKKEKGKNEKSQKLSQLQLSVWHTFQRHNEKKMEPFVPAIGAITTEKSSIIVSSLTIVGDVGVGVEVGVGVIISKTKY